MNPESRQNTKENKAQIGAEKNPLFNVDANWFQTVDFTPGAAPVLAFAYGTSDRPVPETPAHWHNEIEINYRVSGKNYYYVNGKEYIMEPGQTMLLKPNVIHSSGCVEPGNSKIFLINLELLFGHNSEMLEKWWDEFEKMKPVWIMDGSEEWHRDFTASVLRLYDAAQSKVHGAEFITMAEIYRCLGLVMTHMELENQDPDRPASSSIRYLKSMISFIRQHYGEKIYVNDIAAAASISKSSCDKIFHRILNCSPIDYLTDYRIERSMEMLRNGSSVTETALACGFNNLAYFSRQFKKKNGFSPRSSK